MEEIDRIIAEIKTATGWQKVFYKNEYFILEFPLNEMRVIKGLKQGNNTVYLDFESFAELPISFIVNVDEITHQYWTLGGRLHRVGGKPAYVSVDNIKDRVIRRWYWNGLLHRTNGPAKEMISGYMVGDIDGMDGYYQEKWSYMVLEWYQEGFSASFPFINEVELETGTRTRDSKTHKIHSPRPDLHAFYTERANFRWKSGAVGSDFRPMTAEILDLSETYEQGELKERGCSLVDFSWQSGDKTIAAADITKFNEEFRDGELLSLINLWGSFYTDTSTEFLVLSEFGRIGTDS